MIVRIYREKLGNDGLVDPRHTHDTYRGISSGVGGAGYLYQAGRPTNLPVGYPGDVLMTFPGAYTSRRPYTCLDSAKPSRGCALERSRCWS